MHHSRTEKKQRVKEIHEDANDEDYDITQSKVLNQNATLSLIRSLQNLKSGLKVWKLYQILTSQVQLNFIVWTSGIEKKSTEDLAIKYDKHLNPYQISVSNIHY